MTFEEFEEILKNRLLQDAKTAMKDGFSSLSDEMKYKEFCRILDENDEYISREKKLIKYLEDKIKGIKEQISHFNLFHEVGTDLNFLILQRQWYEDILERVKSGKYK